jgi:hypothetical protein
LEEELDKDTVCCQLYSNLYCEYLNKEARECFGDYRIGGKVIRTQKYADDPVLLAKEEAVLQGMAEIQNETGR